MSRAFMTGRAVGAVQATELAILGKPVTGYAVSGTPAQALTHAMVELASQRPGLCVSGVNYRENIGPHLTITGTTGPPLDAGAHAAPRPPAAPPPATPQAPPPAHPPPAPPPSRP